MVRSRLIAVATAAIGGSLMAAFAAGSPADPKGSLACVGPLDAAGIDRILVDAGSPLAGQGATFVNASAAVGLDPRAVVAIAGHETILMTYPPAAAIHNPFGIGPGRVYPDDASAITAAATLLATHYVGEGRTTLQAISGKWAPIGAANDPTNLNANWTAGVGTLYARLGGDPGAPITLDAQGEATCAGPPAAQPSAPSTVPAPTAPIPTATPTGTAADGIVRWDGTAPVVDAPRMDRGADPSSGAPATIEGFVYPVIPGTARPTATDDFATPGTPGCYGQAIRCSVTVGAAPGDGVVAAVQGRLAVSDAAEQAQGIAFWITSPTGDRFGYGQLAEYAPGVAHDATVAAGQRLGDATGPTLVAWERGGHRVNPYPLLAATLR